MSATANPTLLAGDDAAVVPAAELAGGGLAFTKAGVTVVAGDTKVAERGKVDGRLVDTPAGLLLPRIC